MKKCKIILPVTGKSEEEILSQAKECAISACDVVEWRYDLAENVNLPQMLLQLKEMLNGKKLLFTIRTKRQGGAFPDDLKQYCEKIQTAVEYGVDYVDIEDSTEGTAQEQLVAAAHRKKVKVIASYHDFHGTDTQEGILHKLRSLRDTGADIVKTAYMPTSAKDVATLLYATAAFREEDRGQHEMITMSMGELGKISRVSGPVFGSDYTFAALNSVSAPGQMPLEDVQKILAYFS